MHLYRQFGSWWDFEELKRMLAEVISQGFVDEVPVTRRREVSQTEYWYRDKETGDIYSLISPEPPSRGSWDRVNVQELEVNSHRIQ
jgi:hypothetical protein